MRGLREQSIFRGGMALFSGGTEGEYQGVTVENRLSVTTNE